VPIVTPAKRRRQFPWRSNIGVVVQNVTDFIRIFLMDALQRQLCEPLGSMSIKCSAGGTRRWTFLMSSVFSLNAEQGRSHNRARQFPQKRTMKFDDHSEPSSCCRLAS
jgi:hypothetical protein